MYIVKLTQLLRAFYISEQNGIVHLEPLHTTVEEPWTAYLHMHHGEVASCFVHNRNDGRILLESTKALQWLDTKEGFVWTLDAPVPQVSQMSSALLHTASNAKDTELNSPNMLYHAEANQYRQTPLPVQQVAPEWIEAMIPQRVQENIPVTWPRVYTRIFALIDGQRSGEQIAALLHISPERVHLILRDLQAKRVVK